MRITKIMKIIRNPGDNYENHESLRNPFENHETHKIIENTMRIIKSMKM